MSGRCGGLPIDIKNIQCHYFLLIPQRTRHYENKLDELRTDLTKVKLTASEATANSEGFVERETALKTRLEKTQKELDKIKIESRLQATKLQVDCKEIGGYRRIDS